jgi:putative transposase
LWPHKDGDLNRWMQWLMTSHVRRYYRRYNCSGHVWRVRFKAFPVQPDEHYLTVPRYAKRNPLRANMVQRSQDWEWSNLTPIARSCPAGLLHEGPILKPAQWTRHLNGVETEAELKALRHSQTASMLGLESSFRPRGSPRQLKK